MSVIGLPQWVSRTFCARLAAWAGVLCICALAAVPRLYRIADQSFWFDEAFSVMQARATLTDLLSATASDTQPPLYYLLLKLWAALFGESEVALRSLSALFGIAAAALAYLLGRRLFGNLAGWVAGVLAALSPLGVYLSQETRMYTLLLAMLLLAAWGQERGGRAGYGAYAIGAAGALYAHNLGWAGVLALVAYGGVRWSSLEGLERRRWVVATLIAFAVFAPWLPAFADQIAISGRSFAPHPTTPADLIVVMLGTYGGGIAIGRSATIAGAGLVVLALIGVAVWARSRPMAVLLGTLLWIVPTAAVAYLALRSAIFVPRYLLPGMAGVWLLAGAGGGGLYRLIARNDIGLMRVSRGRLNEVVAGAVSFSILAVLLVPMLRAIERQASDPALAHDDYRGITAEITRSARPDDAIVLVAAYQVIAFPYYYHGSLDAVYPMPAEVPADPVDTEDRLNDIRARHPRLWLFESEMDRVDPRGVIRDWLNRNAFQAEHKWFGGLQLSLYELQPIKTGADDQAVQREADEQLDNGVELLSYTVAQQQLRSGDTLPISLLWAAPGGPTVDRWKVFTHLVSADSRTVAQHDSEPVNGTRPTTAWAAGEQVEDHFAVLLADVAPGTYTVIAGMYVEADGRRAHFPDGSDHISLGTIQVMP